MHILSYSSIVGGKFFTIQVPWLRKNSDSQVQDLQEKEQYLQVQGMRFRGAIKPFLLQLIRIYAANKALAERKEYYYL